MVFYVGKGCGRRAVVSDRRSAHWKNVVAKSGGFEVRHLLTGVDEELSLLAEIEAIDKYRRIGVRLVNKTDGGDGTSGFRYVMQDEHKRKIAASKIGKPRPQEVVERMRATKKGRNTGADNPFYGRRHTEETKAILRAKSATYTHTEEHKQKIRQSALKTFANHAKSKAVHCLTNGLTYFSLNEAARQLGLHRRCITMVCNKEMHHTAGLKFEWSTK
jgi:hypothetical protein